MPPPNRMTPEPMIAILRECADRNGGWLSTADYTRLSPKGAPTYPLVGRILNAATWDEVCKAAGIDRTPFDSFPETLNEAQIRTVLVESKHGGVHVPLSYRQQTALYCLRIVAAQLGETRFTAREYDAVADPVLYSSRAIADAFDGWNFALPAAGLEKTQMSNGYKRGRDDERQASMMFEVAGNHCAGNFYIQQFRLGHGK